MIGPSPAMTPEDSPMSKPRVLISDALSPAAVQIFKDRGIDVTFDPSLGKDKEKLAAVIGDYDGLAKIGRASFRERV